MIGDIIKYMDINKAKELLSLHSGRNNDIHNPKWKNGFLGSLRPFRGELNEENFIEIMECLKTLKSEISAPTIEQAIVSDIIGIIHLTRAWTSPYGMLSCNQLLTEEQTKCLLTWIDIIECCFMYLLENDEEDAFFDYEEYLNNKN